MQKENITEIKKEKAEILSAKLQGIIPLIDAFMDSLTEEEFELLEESKTILANRINVNNGALALIIACGGNYDDTEDRMKIKTLDCLVKLIKVRQEYKHEKLSIIESQKKRRETLKMFGIM